MKRYSLKELQERAKDHFDRLQVNKLYATTDGQFFLLENRAILHAGKNLTVHKIENEDADSDTAPATQPMTVKDIVAKVAAMEDLEELSQLLLEEVSGLNRSTAVKAIEERISKLTA